jgi:HlyD family secretion protein
MSAQQIPTVEQRPAQVAAQPPAPAPEQPRRSRRGIMAAMLLLVAIAGGFALWKAFFSAQPVPDNVIMLSGRIEGDDSSVASKATGRILEVRYREGDTVQQGDIIAILDDRQVHAREEQAGFALSQAEARTKSSKDQVAVLQAQLQQNEAELRQQEASQTIAVFDRDAYTRLAQTGAVSERQGKQAQATADQQGEAVAAAKRRVTTVQMQLAQQQSEIAGADANTQMARAQLSEARANRQDLIIRAPFTGTVATRTAEPGEVITTGTAVITLVDMNRVYLRGFVPEGEIGKIKSGQQARVYLDSNPTQPLEAYVSRIDPQATFTPENTYFREDRVKQVVGLRLQLKEGFGFAKPGMPADGAILTSGDHWPEGRWRK